MSNQTTVSADSPALQALCNEYAQRVPAELGDASEALAATTDYELKGYLRRFIVRWNATEALDAGRFGPTGSDAEKMAAALINIAGTGLDVAARNIAITALLNLQAVRS